MKESYRVMLGRGSMYAQECREQGFIGAGFAGTIDVQLLHFYKISSHQAKSTSLPAVERHRVFFCHSDQIISIKLQ